MSRDFLASFLPAVHVAGALCIVAALSFTLLRGWEFRHGGVSKPA
jgi:hypothetical protein